MEMISKAKWNDVKTDLMKAWSDLTHDELDLTGGNVQSVVTLLQKKFGMAREEAATKLMELAAMVEGDQSHKEEKATLAKH